MASRKYTLQKKDFLRCINKAKVLPQNRKRFLGIQRACAVMTLYAARRSRGMPVTPSHAKEYIVKIHSGQQKNQFMMLRICGGVDEKARIFAVIIG
jgi:hypothetical protein